MKPVQHRAIVFADICDSTGLFERYGDVQARHIIAATLALLSQAVQQNDGLVVKTIGDEVMCAFPDAKAAIMAARDMQEGVTADAKLQQHNIAIRIGLHYGKVLVENDDVFGDTVNVAARIVNLAGARQIVATRTAAGDLSDTGIARARELGKVRLRGRNEAIEILELVWRRHNPDVTSTDPLAQSMKHGETSHLSLSYRGQTVTIDLALIASPIRIGRDPNNDLVVNHDLVSRNHASVECRSGYFVFVDRSTNGSYLKVSDDQEFHIHRGEVPLRGAGIISLGQSSTHHDSSLLLRYECQVR